MIRPAKSSDAAELTDLSIRSKGYWGYPAHYFEIWKDELTISADDLAARTIYVYEDRGTLRIAGYYSLVFLDNDLVFSGGVLTSGWWLEHMFVEPALIGKRIGTRLFQHMREICLQRRIGRLSILADPHAQGFYEKMGCVYLGEYASSIPGRTTPHLQYRERGVLS